MTWEKQLIAVLGERCGLSELHKKTCAHCTTGARNLGPMNPDFPDEVVTIDD